MNADELPESPAPQDEAALLGHIVDDLEPRLHAEEWAITQLTAGVTAEAVSASLQSDGWDAETADEIAEKARQATRSLRGVVTPGEVRQLAETHYRKATRFQWFSPFVLLASVWRLMISCAYLYASGSRKRDKS